MVKEKYQPVLDLGKALNIQNGDVKVEVLKIKGTAKTPNEKNILWDKLKETGREHPSDIKANITAADDSIYAIYSENR